MIATKACDKPPSPSRKHNCDFSRPRPLACCVPHNSVGKGRDILIGLREETACLGVVHVVWPKRAAALVMIPSTRRGAVTEPSSRVWAALRTLFDDQPAQDSPAMLPQNYSSGGPLVSIIDVQGRSRTMKRILGAALGMIATSGGAFAADMPVYKAPVSTPAPAYSWSGLYVGGHIGGAWSNNDWFLPNDPMNSVAQQPLGTPSRAPSRVRRRAWRPPSCTATRVRPWARSTFPPDRIRRRVGWPVRRSATTTRSRTGCSAWKARPTGPASRDRTRIRTMPSSIRARPISSPSSGRTRRLCRLGPGVCGKAGRRLGPR